MAARPGDPEPGPPPGHRATAAAGAAEKMVAVTALERYAAKKVGGPGGRGFVPGVEEVAGEDQGFGMWRAVACALALAPAAFAAQPEKLEMYVLEGSAAGIGEAARGLELRDVKHSAAGTTAEAVLTARQASKLRAQGVTCELRCATARARR